jgi:hypothetical protein
MEAHVWLSYAGGMNAAGDNPRAMRPDELRLLVNGTVRGGFASPRPPFYQQEVAWRQVGSQLAFERGVFQGAGFYNSPNGGRLMFAFDGHILSYDIATGSMLQPIKEQVFAARSPHVWFCQRGQHAVAQDGISPPVIITGDTATQGTHPQRGVPTGCMMAEGHGRLFVVSPCRRRIYAGNHSADPTAAPLDFTEDTAYYLNSRYFEMPQQDGRIVALTFAPALNGDADIGPLLVFCENTTRAYDVSRPRETWLTQDISTVPLPTIGACAHAAVVTRGNDVLFSDHEGRIQTVRMAVARNDDSRVNTIDRAVWPLYAEEDATRRDRRWAVEFDSRTLTTVQPERVWRSDGRQSIRHRGIMALQDSPAMPLFPVWDGLWTGIYPVCLIKGADRCFAVSLDRDGIHRLYELSTRAGPDKAPTPKAVPMLAALRPTDLGVPFLPKPIDAVSFRLGAVSGEVRLRGWWANDRSAPKPWFTAAEAAAECLGFSGCSILTPQAQSRPRVNPPAPPVPHFYEAAPWLEITGTATLEEAAMQGKEPKPNPPKVNTHCDPSATADFTCPPDPWSYHASAAPDATITSTPPCPTLS